MILERGLSALGTSFYMNSSYGLANRTNVEQDSSVDADGYVYCLQNYQRSKEGRGTPLEL